MAYLLSILVEPLIPLTNTGLCFLEPDPHLCPSLPGRISQREDSNVDRCCVCGSDVDRFNPPAQENYQGQTYNFCCQECKEKFDSNPSAYARSQAA